MKGYNLTTSEQLWKDFKIKCINEDVSLKSTLIRMIEDFTYGSGGKKD